MDSLHRGAMLALVVAILGGCQAGGEVRRSSMDSSLYDGSQRLLYEVEKGSTAGRTLEMADAARRAGDTDRALFIYLQMAEQHPDMSLPLVQVSRIHRERGNVELAERALRQVLQRRPDDLLALAELGTLQLARQQNEQAATTLAHALSVDQRRLGGNATAPKVDAVSPWRLYHGLGVLADLGRDFDKAQASYLLARQIDPQSAVVANSQGYSRYLAGDWDKAAAFYQEAIRFDRQQKYAWRNLGLLRARQQRYEEALAAFEQVESRAEASNDVGYACMLDGHFSDAEGFFHQAMQLSPSHYETARQNLQRLQQLQRLRAEHPASQS